jgi:hypothetical protein
LKIRYDSINGLREEQVAWSEEYENINEAISLTTYTKKPIPQLGRYKIIKIHSPIEK